MSERGTRPTSRRASLRSSLQSSQLSDQNFGADDEYDSVGGDSMSFAMRSANQSFLSVGYRQENDSDWDDDDGRRSVRSAVSATSSRRYGRGAGGGHIAGGSRSGSRLIRADGTESLEASLNSLRSSHRSSRRRLERELDNISLHSRASAHSAASRSSRRRSQRRGAVGDAGRQYSSFLSDGASEDVVTAGFGSPLFALGPGTFAETRSLTSSHRSGRSGDDGAGGGRIGPHNSARGGASASESYNSYTLDANTTQTTLRAHGDRRTRKGARKAQKVTREMMLRKTNVPLAFVTAHLAHRQRRIALCRDFFLFMPLLILFCFFAEYHITTVSRFSLITQSLRQQYERRGYPADQSSLEWFRQEELQGFRRSIKPTHFFRSVRSVVDFDSFYINSILRGTFVVGNVSTAYTGSGTLATDVGKTDILEPNASNIAPLRSPLTLRLLGALRVRTVRVRALTAPVQENLYDGAGPNFSRQTWSQKVTKEAEATAPYLCPTVTNPLNRSQPLYVYHACEDMPYQIYLQGTLTNYHCGGYIFEVPFDINGSIAQQFVATAMASCAFVSTAASRLAAIEFFTYSPSLDGFTQVKFMIEISAGGYTTTRALFRPFLVYTSARRGQVVYSVVVLAYTVVYLAVCVTGLVRAVRAKRLISWIKTWYHWIDFAVLGCALGALGSFCQWISVSLSVADNIRWSLPPNYPVFLDYVESVYVRWIEMCVATTVFLFVRLFRFTEFFSPLEILWKTALRSLGNVFAALIVYALMLVGYSLCGWAVFGPFSPAFRNIPNALVTLSLFFISDTWYYPIDNVNVQFQFLFFWSYVFFAFTLPLAVLCSTFAHTLSRVARLYALGDNESFFSEKMTVFVRTLNKQGVKRFFSSLIGVRRDAELMERLTQQLHNFNRVQQDFYLFSVHEKMEREIDDRMREFREHRAGITAAISAGMSNGTWDDSEGSGFSSPLGGTLARSAENTTLSSALLEASGSVSALKGASKEIAKQTFSSLAQSMSAYVGSSVEASDLGLGTLFENHAATAEVHPSLDDESALQRITQHVQAQYASQLSPDDIEVRFADWPRVVPADLYKACGGSQFFESLWLCDIVPAWLAHLATPAEKERTDFIQHTQAVTRAALATQLTKVKLLDSTLRKLEAHVAVAQDVLDARNADDRESSDGEEI